ncbi:Fibronectin type 3 and ankyrin repeat domains protein 1 like [Verticillium longisporum]|uniref:Fibronectin type 3 and ankyrin repeat domains protein 1 like n=1 Tax=Verticillium longisporum TaxID=100787 RepID=A0A8I2ZEV1_VERLO|nr:Fibronectin type 3 and ankyrin repeat domains protein 1 like [Verticillium longisporum]
MPVVQGLELRKQLSSNTLAIAELESVGLEGAVQDTAILEVAKLLIDAGADINYCSDIGSPPLAIAVERNRMEVAELFIGAGADMNHRDNF